MTGTEAKAKVKKSLGPGGSMKHSEMGRAYRSLGSNLVEKASRDSVTAMSDQKIGVVTSLKLRKVISNKIYANPKWWGSYYRQLSPGQDELIPTSAIREIVVGAAGGASLSPEAEATMEAMINEISRIRFPTNWTGFARGIGTGDDRMQHPTAAGKGMWRSSLAKGDGNPHSKLDRARKEAILEDMVSESAKGSNLQTIKNAGIARAISFTLNDFLAPAMAMDQYPINESERIAQTLEREKVKKTGVSYGCAQETGDTSLNRIHGNRQGQRSLSPPRTI
jgi:hypothetical protein